MDRSTQHLALGLAVGWTVSGAVGVVFGRGGVPIATLLLLVAFALASLL